MRYYFLFLITLLFTAATSSGQISGSGLVCAGSNTLLSCTTPTGGTWSSSNPAVAVVDAGGTVTGNAAGTAIITYQLLPTIHTLTVTVNPIPSPITSSSFSVCAGDTIMFSSATAGGIWASTETGVVSVDISSGVGMGVSSGVTVVQYILATGCSRSASVTVNALPAVITGPASVCVGSSVTLSNASSSGTWSSSNPSFASVDSISGLVTGVSAGTTSISYRMSGTGCARLLPLTVNPVPASISGSTSICNGSFVTYSATPTGGSWSVGTSGPVSIHPVTGVASGVSPGSSHISYTLSTGCSSATTVTVYPLPSAISGPSTVCPGGTITLINTVSGGIWVSGSTAVATVGSAPGDSTTVTGLTAGTSLISYVTAGSCMAVTTVTVLPLPSAGSISGPSIVCPSTSITLTSSVTGGTWSSSSVSIATVGSSGIVSGLAVGTADIVYAVNSVCGTATAIQSVNVSVPPSAITGPSVMCAGTTSTLANSVSGGVWSTSSTAIATIGMGSGLVTGISGGTVLVSYTLAPACLATTVLTVNAAPSPISGPDQVCVGSVITLSDTASGGVWTSSAPTVATVGVIGISSGAVSGIAAGTTIITYSLGICPAFWVVTVNAVPAVATSATADTCGGGYVMNATGASAYLWTPATGLGCATCSTTSVMPVSTVTYTLTGTNAAGCSNNSTVTVNGDRIYGHIQFYYGMPASPDVKVWLVQFNPGDSSIIATDSTVSCLDAGTPYYEFLSKPSGTYLVKARLISSVAGTTGYLPTYGDSVLYWYEATSVSHSGASDMRDVIMKYGIVPSGPGFISGFVYSGAGKGTSGEIPEAGMLIYLKDATTGKVLTYTYTDAAGQYSFSSIATGNYIIYPEAMDYYTTPSAIVNIADGATTVTGVSFKKHTVGHTIYPYTVTGTDMIGNAVDPVKLFPNPASNVLHILPGDVSGDVVITVNDIAGRSLLTVSEENMATGAPVTIDISLLNDGIYIVNIRSSGAEVSRKLIVAHR